MADESFEKDGAAERHSFVQAFASTTRSGTGSPRPGRRLFVVCLAVALAAGGAVAAGAMITPGHSVKDTAKTTVTTRTTAPASGVTPNPKPRPKPKPAKRNTPSPAPRDSYTPAPAQAAPAKSSPAPTRRAASPATAVSKTLYSFDDGTTDGWQGGANVTAVSAVSSFADGPGHPYEGSYALDASSMDGADIPVARTVSVTPATPLNLSSAKYFYFAVDGYGYAPYATGYTVRVTLYSGNQALTGSASVQANTWTKIVLPMSPWAGTHRITSISISYAGVGSDTPWYPHFQIDDVGYTT